jgi:undecaprenyl diphosphate synthase
MEASNIQKIPRHIAIIMDGNGRWAKQRGMPRIEGHRRGVETVRQVIEGAKELGVRYLTLYAFSVENWKRPQDEVGGLMRLLEFFLERETATLIKNRVRLLTIGRTQELPELVRRQLEKAKAETAAFRDHTLILALNYGARNEILEATQAFSTAQQAGREPQGTPTWEAFSRYLYTADIPDPDLVIRTSGEMRISNFLLMQAAYAEFIFTPTLWPDFSKADLAAAVSEYSKRERRYGLTSEQVKAS